MARVIFRAYSDSATSDCERQLDRFANFNIEGAGKFLRMAIPRGLEPPTFGLGNRCSIRLSYGTIERFQ
jgi:hypothetical protein